MCWTKNNYNKNKFPQIKKIYMGNNKIKDENA